MKEDMKIVKLSISNFRGIKETKIYFNGHTALVGDNNTGKSTILEAIDLVLGPERLSRHPIIDEHDFFAGEYVSSKERQSIIKIELIVCNLNAEQQRHFNNHIEWWNIESNELISNPPPESTEDDNVYPALRVQFQGYYDENDDDFKGDTFFSSPHLEDGSLSRFYNNDKRKCGFLFLRTLRTGSRALSLEHGSLLDIILRINDIRPKMWEDVLEKLRDVQVADKPEIGITEILTSVQNAIRKIVPSEWAKNPKLLVSNMTRMHLRKILTVFMSTGVKTSKGKDYAAPFQYQGTGTINTLVLALLSIIAENKQNVIFAMEEPEIAIPPYTQKRVITNVIDKSSQAIFTSHSPYVLEEFNPKNILVVQRNNEGYMTVVAAQYPPAIKPKKYKEEFRKRFCEALLSRRVLITEGRTEYDSFPVCARKLSKMNSELYNSFEALGIAVISAETDSQIAPLGKFLKELGKEVFAVFDKQTSDDLAEIESNVDYPFEAQEKGFENMVTNGIDIKALRRYALSLVNDGLWPTHLSENTPNDIMGEEELKGIMKTFLKARKGSGEAAELLTQCTEEEMPQFIVDTIKEVNNLVVNRSDDSSREAEKDSTEETDLNPD